MQIKEEERVRLAYNLGCDLKIGEISELVDKLYEDTYNIKLPIIITYSLIIFKANGATPEEFEKRMAYLRETWR